MTGRVLVTGAAGFIGGYVVAELLARGYEVVGLDNLSKYGEVSRVTASNPAYTFIRGDASDPELMIRLLSGCDHLIAGAAMVGGIAYFHAYPYDLLAANERITAAACDAAIAAYLSGGLRKVTFVSSSMVYEQAVTWPSREGQERRMPPPATAYGFQKLAVEYFARAARDQHGLPFTIVRPFNCVGVGETRSVREPGTPKFVDMPTLTSAAGGIPEPGGMPAPGGAAGSRRAMARPDGPVPGRGLAGAGEGTIRLAMSHVVPDLVYRVLAGQDPLRILGSGDQLRHYTYGGDLARGIVTAMEHPAAVGEDFNLSTGRGTTVRELANLIWRKIKGPDSPPRIVNDPPYADDVQRRVPDTSKARRVLGFEAVTPLETMLDEVISWVRGAMSAGLM